MNNRLHSTQQQINLISFYLYIIIAMTTLKPSASSMLWASYIRMNNFIAQFWSLATSQQASEVHEKLHAFKPSPKVYICCKLWIRNRVQARTNTILSWSCFCRRLHWPFAKTTIFKFISISFVAFIVICWLNLDESWSLLSILFSDMPFRKQPHRCKNMKTITQNHATSCQQYHHQQCPADYANLGLQALQSIMHKPHGKSYFAFNQHQIIENSHILLKTIMSTMTSLPVQFWLQMMLFEDWTFTLASYLEWLGLNKTEVHKLPTMILAHKYINLVVFKGTKDLDCTAVE